MSVYAGLDTSLDAVAICVIAETGEMLWQGKVLGDPDAVTAALQRWRDDLVRVGLEAGATSEWIGGHLVDEGFPVVCLESRHVKAALGAMTVKTDRNDAQGIAQIVRTGWFKAVHLKSAAGQRLRTLTAARKAAVRAVTANEQVIRGLLRPLGLKIGAVTRVRFEARVRQLIGADRLLLGIFENGYVESFNGRMRDELLNESLFFGLDHARSAIAEWRQDFNTAKPHSSLGYQTPAAFAETLAATGSDAALNEGFASPPVAQTAPYGVTETAEALIATG
ncbi:hypothetical protein EOD29_27635 [Mesorhizobium sp. M1A.T.Ca.IN.004.03.1.1]|nr:hypothetical protein EOD29_27635 [Mesorhizobium sp. M1A.T.Ca.IN.004.03.1.1]